MSFRRWCYTLNNYTEADIASMKAVECVFHIIGKEIGKEGTPHLQGYISFKQSHRLAGMKKIHPTAHWEPCNGDHDQNVAYCSKTDKAAWIYDNRGKGQGKRNDLLELTKDLDNKATDDDIITKYPVLCLRMSKHIDAYRRLKVKPRDFQTKVVVITGKPGSGKSRWVHEVLKDLDYWSLMDISPNGTVWFDGYIGQDYVVIDDFDGSIPIKTLLKMADRYKFTVQVKGGSVQFRPKWIFITCNRPPHTYYKDIDYDNECAIKRRITHNYVAGACVSAEWFRHEMLKGTDCLIPTVCTKVEPIKVKKDTKPGDSMVDRYNAIMAILNRELKPVDHDLDEL